MRRTTRLGARLALAIAVLAAAVAAQNGSSFHVLSNGFDVVVAGVGAGTFSDPDGVPGSGDELVAGPDGGLGYWVPGEDLSGATVTAAFGTFGYRIAGWREQVCVLTAGLNTTGAGVVIGYPHVSFHEHVSANANCPTCFTNPLCSTAAPGALLPSSQGYPGPCFALSGVPSAFGPSSLVVLVPDTTLGLSTNPIYVLAAANDTYLDIPDASLGLCWIVEFGWAPSALPLQDGIEGLWTYRRNAPDGNQYWGLSNDEVGLWNSCTWSLLTDLGAGGQIVLTHPANQDYTSHLVSRDATTSAALAPAGFHGTANPFYDGPIPNGQAAPGSGLDANQGFDVGRGARAIALSGTGGAAGPLGTGNQALVNNPPNSLGVGANLTTLGFSSYDDPPRGTGSARLVVCSIDLEGSLCVPTGSLVPDLTRGPVRIPFNAAGFVSFGPAVNATCGVLFGHETAPGYPDPDVGLPPPPGSLLVGGHSVHVPTSPQAGACAGMPVNLTYGSVPLAPDGKLDVLGAFGTTSGRRELFLMF